MKARHGVWMLSIGLLPSGLAGCDSDSTPASSIGPSPAATPATPANASAEAPAPRLRSATKGTSALACPPGVGITGVHGDPRPGAYTDPATPRTPEGAVRVYVDSIRESTGVERYRAEQFARETVNTADGVNAALAKRDRARFAGRRDDGTIFAILHVQRHGADGGWIVIESLSCSRDVRPSRTFHAGPSAARPRLAP